MQLPYWNIELLTMLNFKPHALIVVIDFFYNIHEKIEL